MAERCQVHPQKLSTKYSGSQTVLFPFTTITEGSTASPFAFTSCHSKKSTSKFDGPTQAARPHSVGSGSASLVNSWKPGLSPTNNHTQQSVRARVWAGIRIQSKASKSCRRRSNNVFLLQTSLHLPNNVCMWPSIHPPGNTQLLLPPEQEFTEKDILRSTINTPPTTHHRTASSPSHIEKSPSPFRHTTTTTTTARLRPGSVIYQSS